VRPCVCLFVAVPRSLAVSTCSHRRTCDAVCSVRMGVGPAAVRRVGRTSLRQRVVHSAVADQGALHLLRRCGDVSCELLKRWLRFPRLEQVLRQIARLSTTVLFIPLLRVLVTIFACTSGEWMSSGLVCFHTWHAVAALGIGVLVALFSVFSLLGALFVDARLAALVFRVAMS
jgi:hypothetical protein